MYISYKKIQRKQLDEILKYHPNVNTERKLNNFIDIYGLERAIEILHPQVKQIVHYEELMKNAQKRIDDYIASYPKSDNKRKIRLYIKRNQRFYNTYLNEYLRLIKLA